MFLAALQTVTCSRCHIVCVVAAVAVQEEVDFTACRCVVGHVRGARHVNSDQPTGIADSGIADHCAALANCIVGDSGAGDVVAADAPGGGNPDPLARKASDSNEGITLYDPCSANPQAAGAAAAENTQSLNDGSVAAKSYPGIEPCDRPVLISPYRAPIG